MKKILNLEGIQQLSKKEQQNIIGASGSTDIAPYCNGPNTCCERTPNGSWNCGRGECLANGGCRWA